MNGKNRLELLHFPGPKQGNIRLDRQISLIYWWRGSIQLTT